MATPHVVVIGAGIIGLSTAVRVQQQLLQRTPARVTVVAENWGIATTSHGAAGAHTPHTIINTSTAGLWEPYYVSDTPPADLVRWGAATFDHLQRLFHSTHAAQSGTSCIVGASQTVL